MYAIIVLVDLLGGRKMTYAQVRKFFENKRDVDCHITNELIAKGYRQKKRWIHKDSARFGIK